MAHKDLQVWQRAMELAETVYRLTESFPREEVYGLTAQVRRAAVSVPSNIAEGAGRESKKEFAQFLMYARGSLSELETQLLLAQRLDYLSAPPDLFPTIKKLFRSIGGLYRSLQSRG